MTEIKVSVNVKRSGTTEAPYYRLFVVKMLEPGPWKRDQIFNAWQQQYADVWRPVGGWVCHNRGDDARV